MSKKNIWISDLTHTAQGISANTFPLGISYVAAYAKKELGNNYDIRLFKFPLHLAEALHKKTPPTMLCFSNGVGTLSFHTDLHLWQKSVIRML